MKEWRQFERNHFRAHYLRLTTAVFIGVLFFSGLTYSAISYWHERVQDQTVSKNQKGVGYVTNAPKNQSSTLNVFRDSTQQTCKVFENVPLQNILSEMAAYYGLYVTYSNGNVKNIRLYFNWDKKQSAEDALALFNKFEKISITQKVLSDSNN